LGAIRGAIGWLNLPFDIQTLWNFFWRWIAPALPALVSIVLGYLYNAPYWQIALIAAGIFALFYLSVFGIVVLRRRSSANTQTDASTSTVPTARGLNTQNEAAGEASPEVSRPAVSVPLDERQRQIDKWRTEIENGDFTRTPHGHSQFFTTETYVEMEPLLQRHVKNRMRSHAGAAVAWISSPHLRGTEGDRRAMIGELVRIQEEWGVV
jgi:hypothetical protein